MDEFEDAMNGPFINFLAACEPHDSMTNFSAKMLPPKIFQGLIFWGFLLSSGISPFNNKSLARGWAKK